MIGIQKQRQTLGLSMSKGEGWLFLAMTLKS